MIKSTASVMATLAAAMASTILLGCSPKSGGAAPSGSGQSATTTLSQSELDAASVMTPEAEAALAGFVGKDDHQRSEAIDALMGLQPLPKGARERLRSLLTDGDKMVREYATKILAYHHIGSAEDLAAIEAAAAQEADKNIKTTQEASMQRLRGPAPRVAVIPDSDALDAALSEALLKALQKQGRSIRSIVMSERGPNGVKVSGSLSADTDDLPETLAVGGGEAILGWDWNAKFSDDNASVASESSFSTEIKYSRANTTPEAAPIGATLRIAKPIKLAKSRLAAGSCLVRSDYGWSVVELPAVLQWLDGQLRTTAEIGYPVPRVAVNAAFGIAAFGPEAKSLLPTLLELGADTNTLVYRLRALARIHDASVVPKLREWRAVLKDSPGLQEAIDSSIAEIER